MRHIIDLKTWDRADNYRFFLEFLNPCISITTEIDCTAAKAVAKEKQRSFFLYYLYAILRAANEVDEFRYRIEGDEVAFYDQVDMLTPIQANAKGKFVTALIPYYDNFETFYAEARKVIESVSEETDPYEAEYRLRNTGHYNIISLSATPDLYFTSMGYAQIDRKGSKYPLMNAGKAVQKEGKLMMPFSINVHHGLVDGFHIGKFFKLVEQHLNGATFHTPPASNKETQIKKKQC